MASFAGWRCSIPFTQLGRDPASGRKRGPSPPMSFSWHLYAEGAHLSPALSQVQQQRRSRQRRLPPPEQPDSACRQRCHCLQLSLSLLMLPALNGKRQPPLCRRLPRRPTGGSAQRGPRYRADNDLATHRAHGLGRLSRSSRRLWLLLPRGWKSVPKCPLEVYRETQNRGVNS